MMENKHHNEHKNENETARERAQSRFPFFPSMAGRMREAAAQAKIAAAKAKEACIQGCDRLAAWISDTAAPMLSFRALGRILDSGVLSRVTPGAWAALLSAAVLLLLALWGEMASLLRPSGIAGVLLSFMGTIVCVLLPAVLGLAVCPAEGDRPLSAEQRFDLFASGALCLCPLSLLADLTAALPARFGAALPVPVASAPDAHLFLPMLLVSGVAAPLCEELFFRGALRRLLCVRGERFAAAVSALVFAAAHGTQQFAVYALLGLLLYAVVWRTQSLAAGMIVHCMYNITIIVISFMGLSGLFTGLSLISCALRLAGTAAFFAMLMRLWRARRLQQKKTKGEGFSLTRREWGMTGAAAGLLLLSQILAEVFRG